MLKRLFDLTLAIASLPLVLPLAAIAAITVLIADGRPVLYWSDRIGRGGTLFRMPKFRTMRRSTPAVATHLLADPGAVLIPAGGFLRMTSFDELPQLWSVIRGDMSLVGPRPALFNQDDLISLRSECGVERLRPGVTGWAQVNGRDDLSIPEKVEYDKAYLSKRSVAFDIYVIILTVIKIFGREGVRH